nr:formylglycine-generating enzyme family protein [Actinomyces ruminicola]
MWEWCWDYLDPGRYGDYWVFRGGSWADPPWSVRASVRRGSAPDAVVDGTGLRLAQGPVGTSVRMKRRDGQRTRIVPGPPSAVRYPRVGRRCARWRPDNSQDQRREVDLTMFRLPDMSTLKVNEDVDSRLWTGVAPRDRAEQPRVGGTEGTCQAREASSVTARR